MSKEVPNLPKLKDETFKIENDGSDIGENVGYIGTKLSLELDTMNAMVLSRELGIKSNADANLSLERIKHEHIMVEGQDRSDSLPPPFEMVKIENFESDMYVDTEEFGYTDSIELSKDFKSDTDTNAFHTEMDIQIYNASISSEMPFTSAIKKKIVDKGQTAYSKTGRDSFSCCYCNHSGQSKYHMNNHMEVHMDRKNIYKCDCCNFQTSSRRLLTTHERTHTSNNILTHFNEIHKKQEGLVDSVTGADQSYANLNTSQSPKQKFKNDTSCIQCDATFKGRIALDDHMIRKHPNFIAYVTSRIHECKICSYKTTYINSLNKHMLKHAEAGSSHSYKLNRCKHCKKAFKSKTGLDYHVIKNHPSCIGSITRKIHTCTRCTFKTTSRNDLNRHMLKHPEIAANYNFSTCVHCNASFKSNMALDDHIIKKHPSFISSVTSRLFECKKCAYKTTFRYSLDRHLLNHPEITASHKFSRCVHCNALFKCKKALDNHVIKKHPNFIPALTRRIFECRLCIFKTTISNHLERHMLKHPGAATSYKLKTCLHCSAAFNSKQLLDDHLIKKHPSFISVSVTSQIHECTKCTFKTTFRHYLDRHLLTHPETASTFKFNTCKYCNTTFKSKQALDDHIVKQHNEFISLVTSQIHECTKCTFKTTFRHYLDRHLLKHPETAAKFKFNTCKHCNTTFKSKQALGDHIIKQHTDFITSVTSKIHECENCTFKTTYRHFLDSHVLKKHPETAASSVFNTCIHCNAAFKSRQVLDDHIIKNHRDFIGSVTSQIHACTECTFKTTFRHYLSRHLLKHPQTAANYNFITCDYCNAIFKSKQALGDHIINKHTNFISSVTSKIHECQKCTYKTTYRHYLDRHVLKQHPEEAADVMNTCIYCNIAFTSKQTLDDHIIQEHPSFISAITSQIHECPMCNFKTTFRHYLERHLLKHPETAADYNFNICVQCNASFKSRQTLDDHIIKKHPSYISSITSKIHECTRCTFKTTISSNFHRHLSKHLEEDSSCSLNFSSLI